LNYLPFLLSYESQPTTPMKIIYLFSYQFKQEKRGLLNYQTFVIVNGDMEEYGKNPLLFLQNMQARAELKFQEKFPHVDFDTVEVSEFKGDVIDKCEPAE
jgi:hypothetical protein